MTDYYAQLHGQFQNGAKWSTGVHITSTQTPAAMATTWTNAISAAWTDGTHGLGAIYPTTTITNSTTLATLDARMTETAKILTPLSLAGASSDNSLPFDRAFLVSLRSPGVKRGQRGRMFLPAPVEGIVVNGVYTGTAGTRVKAAITAAFTNIRADGSTIFVFPRRPWVDGTPAFTKTVITDQFASLKPSTIEARTDKMVPTYV